MKNIQEFKKQLEKEKVILLDELKAVSVLNPENGRFEAVPESQNGPEADENDLADRFEDFDERTSTVKTFAGRLREINSALEKIENNTYGKCEICDTPVEEARLHANPAAKTCIKHMAD